jgi:hypothetical protein
MNADTTFLLSLLVMVPLVVLWGAALFDIVIRRRDLSLGRKSIWSVLVVLVPYVGVLMYAALRTPRAATPTDGEDQSAAGAAIRELGGLVEAHDSGMISDAEFSHGKAAVFGLTAPND